MAVERDIIHKSGAWFSYKDQRIGQGRENTRQYLKDNPEVAQEIDAEIRRQFFEKGEPLPEQSEGGESAVEEEDDLALLEEDGLEDGE